jgi:poly-gamma-glutamate synthesis protein (capsule biosynthesis protein)
MSSQFDIRIALVGDIYFGDTFPEISSELKLLLSKCDAVIGNLETPICDAAPTKNPKLLRAPISEAQGEKTILSSVPGTEQVLVDWGVTAVSLANNHILDCGLEGFTQTVDRLEKVGIRHFGVGQNLSEASMPLILTFGDRSVGFIAGADSRSTSYLASRREFGCNPMQKPEIREQICDIRDHVDWIVMLPHWGVAGKSYPELSSFLLGQYLLDEGADVVAGHHSHIVHGSKQIRDNTYLAYSLGNFYFAPFTRANKEEIVFHGKEIYGAILILVFAPDGVTLSHQWHFTKQVGNRIVSDNTKKRYKMHSSQSAFISKTGPQYVQALRNRESKEHVFSLVRRIFRPVKSLLSTVKRFFKSVRVQ